MARLAIFFSVLLLAFSVVHSQTTATDTLSIHEGFFGLSYKQGDRDMSSGDFKNLLKTNPDTTIFQLFGSGSTMSSVGDVLGGIGGFGLGFGIASKPSKTALTIAGGVVAAIGIVLNVEGARKMREAVTRYNHATAESAPHSSLIELERRTPLVAVSISF